MTNFTVTGSWTSQGTVNGTVSFTPIPASAGTPASATISASSLSTTLPVIAGSYLVNFQGMTLNGLAGVVENFVFASPQSAVSVSLNSISSTAAQVVTATTPPSAAVGPLSYASSAIPGTITLTNSTTAAQIAGLTLSAGQLAIGSTFRTTIRGTIQNAATSGTLTFSPFVGPNVAAQTFQMPSQTSAAGPVAFFLQHDVTVQQTGATGAYVCNGYGRMEAATPVVFSTTSTSTALVDTTQPSFLLQTTAQWATANAANTLVVATAAIERVV